jgi:zinc transport system substrate-binding protein
MSNKLLWTGGVIVVGVLAGLAWLVSLGSINTRPDDGRLVVAATIFPLADIVGNVGGDLVRVVQVIPPGASPHSYSLTPQQVADIQPARVVFMIGHGLDDAIVAAIENVVEAEDDVNIVRGDEGIRLRGFAEQADVAEEIGHEPGGVDPHYWLAVPNALQIASAVAAELVRLDPAHRDQYESNLVAYQANLAALEQELQSNTSRLDQQAFVAMHGGWSYFAGQYGLMLVGTYEPVEGREPSPTDLQRLQFVIQKHGITTFYTEPQKLTTSAVRFIQDEFGLTIDVLDPVGGMVPGDSYVELMRRNMEAIVRGSQP